jgi:heme-degrading monooxygenase HmoA
MGWHGIWRFCLADFRDAHKNAGQHKVLYLGHPQFEGFSVVEGRK